ncbi:hypothetical protein LTR49_013966 [Elasticomyces elasticus]|nr:hypothetical protein LTR49_013966 [Elasticomyces elasticus]
MCKVIRSVHEKCGHPWDRIARGTEPCLSSTERFCGQRVPCDAPEVQQTIVSQVETCPKCSRKLTNYRFFGGNRPACGGKIGELGPVVTPRPAPWVWSRGPPPVGPRSVLQSQPLSSASRRRDPARPRVEPPWEVDARLRRAQEAEVRRTALRWNARLGRAEPAHEQQQQQQQELPDFLAELDVVLAG